MPPLKIGNIMLGTTDLERSVAFYHVTLGLPLQGQTEGFAFLEAGSLTLSLSIAHARLADPVAGAVEIVFAVDGVQEAHRELRDKGIEFLNEPRNVTGDQWAANFRDPDGYLLSIFGPEHRDHSGADTPPAVPGRG